MANGRFLIGKPSGGVTTVTSVDGAGNTNLVLPESGAVATTAGATETSTGLVELATTAETQAGTDDLRAITALKLFNSLKGSNQNLTTSGYQKLHGGLIIQWGTQTPPGNAIVQTYNFPLVFPTNCLTFVASLGMGGNGGVAKNDATGGRYISSSQYQMANHSGGSAIKIDWIAIGY